MFYAASLGELIYPNREENPADKEKRLRFFEELKQTLTQEELEVYNRVKE